MKGGIKIESGGTLSLVLRCADEPQSPHVKKEVGYTALKIKREISARNIN